MTSSLQTAWTATVVLAGIALATPAFGQSEQQRSDTGSTTAQSQNRTGSTDSRDSTARQGQSTAGQSDTTKSGTTSGAMPVVVLVPMVYAADANLADGCWARLYDATNFSGNMLTLIGPVDIARARPASVTGFELGRNYDSVIVGPKARLQVWDNDGFRDKNATFSAGQRVADLDDRMGQFEEIKSAKITCQK